MSYNTRSKKIILDEEFENDLNNKCFDIIDETEDEEDEEDYEEDINDDFICYCELENCICKTQEEEDIKNPYKKFVKKTLDIVNGLTYLNKMSVVEMQKQFTEEQMNDLLNKLDELECELKNDKEIPTMIDILQSDLSISKKKEMIKYLMILNSDTSSDLEYECALTELKKNFNSKITENIEKTEIEQQIMKELLLESSLKDKILKSDMPFNVKVIAFSKYLESALENKNILWLNSLLRIPFNKYSNLELSFEQIRENLDKDLSFMEIPKDKILGTLMKTNTNNQAPLTAISLYGKKGTGKTQFAKSLAKSLNRPFFQISLGGDSDSNSLLGFSYTYQGSTYGRIVDCLINGQVMNPIIFFDECDKISQVRGEYDIMGTLIHLIDTTTNSKWNQDKFFSGIEFDLSKVMFIFAFNDEKNINHILFDRMHKICINDYTNSEKIIILEEKIIPKLMEEYKFSNVKFTKDSIQYILGFSNEDGLRTCKHIIDTILSRINILKYKNKDIIKLGYVQLYEYYTEEKQEYIIEKNHIDLFIQETERIKDNFPYHMYV